MSGIQLILLSGLVFIGLYFIIRLKRRLLDVLLLGMLSGIACSLVLWPDYTNIVAKTLGVGRGADLVFYLSILIFWFIILKLFARIRQLEKTITDVLRQDAIDKAENKQDKLIDP